MSRTEVFYPGDRVEIIMPKGYIAESLWHKREGFIGQIATITSNTFDVLTDGYWYHIDIGNPAALWHTRWFRRVPIEVPIDVETLL